MRACDGSWRGWGPLRSYIFAGDAIFAETEIVNILEETVDAREAPRLGLFGMDSINEDKTKLDGAWSTKALVSGFDIDNEEATIFSPSPKVGGARIYVLRDEFVVGSQRVTQKSSQTLRGYMNHWLAASL